MTEAIASAIAFEDVSKRYGEAARLALDHVSLTIAQGEFIALVGQSGSGKSTLLSMINRLTDPSEGVVRFHGEDVRHLDPIALRRRIGYVFQDIGLFPHMTLAENIAIVPKLLGWDNDRQIARADELLRMVQLPPEQYRSRLPRELSGGQRQRVGVARAIAAAPKIVLMDEPFGALDLRTRDALTRDYRKLHDELHLTTVMITHDVIEAVLLADRIAVMQDGKLLGLGTPKALMSDPQNVEVRALMDMPRRQAERLTRLMQGGIEDGAEHGA